MGWVCEVSTILDRLLTGKLQEIFQFFTVTVKVEARVNNFLEVSCNLQKLWEDLEIFREIFRDDKILTNASLFQKSPNHWETYKKDYLWLLEQPGIVCSVVTNKKDKGIHWKFHFQ